MPNSNSLLTALALLSTLAAGEITSDRHECAQELALLSPCLEYVLGGAPAPSPDCCAGLEKVKAAKPKCLCVLIRDRDGPDLGVKINATLAISLPLLCDTKMNVSHCPKLLNLPPDSKDAEIFKQPGVTAAKGKGSSSNSSAATGATGGVLGNSIGVRVEKVGGIWLIYSAISLLLIFVDF